MSVPHAEPIGARRRSQGGRRYHFADLTLDQGRRVVSRGGEPIPLSRLSYRLLQTLVEFAPNVVSIDELARRVWRRPFVSLDAIRQRVKLLRSALSDPAASPRYVGLARGQGQGHDREPN